MLRVGIFGNGRLGSAVARLLQGNEHMALVWVGGPGEFPDIGVDVLFDASLAAAVPEHLDWAIRQGIALVIAVTGWTIPDLAERVTSAQASVLVAPNLSLSLAFVRRLTLLLGRFSVLHPGDTFILEQHHAAKLDAPSGTAIALARALMAGNPDLKQWSNGAAQKGHINMASIRAGNCIGYHEVCLDSGNDAIKLSHSVGSRDMFATGALLAMSWLYGRKGFFSFDDCASELLDPLFASN